MAVQTQLKGRSIAEPKTVYYTGSDTLLNGYALCYDTAGAAVAATTQNVAVTAAQSREKVVKPSWANLVAQDAFAGSVVNAPRGGYVGPCYVDIIPFDANKKENVSVYTDENVAAGDLLGPLPGFYYFGRAVVGAPRFEAREAQNRSATLGLVNGCLGPIDPLARDTKILRHFDHFLNPNVPGVVAGVLASHDYLLNGTTAIAERAVNAAAGGPASAGCGELSIVGTTTTIGQMQQIGAPWALTAGRSIFCRQRVKIDDISDEDWFIGLGTAPTVSAGVLTAVAQIASAGTTPNGTDYLGFYFDATGGTNGFINFNARKASGTQQTQSQAVAFVNNTYIDLAFLVRNRLAGAAAGAKTIYTFVNGVLTTSFETATYAAAVPDTVCLAWAMSGITGGCVGTIDRLEIAMNL